MLLRDESPLKVRRNEAKAQAEPFPLEWLVCEDETSWQQSIGEPPAPPPARSLYRRLPQWVGQWGAPLLLLLMVIIGIGGWWIWQTAQKGMAEIEAELQTAIVGESWLIAHQGIQFDSEESQSWQTHIAAEGKQLLRLAESGELIADMQIVDLGRDWARVQVTVESLNNSILYRQTRVYRQNAQDWVRTAPTAAHWGQPRQLETSFFSIHYFSQDEEAVTEMEDRLDSLYADIYMVFHENEPSSNEPNGQQIVIQIDPTMIPGELPIPTSSPNTSHNTIVVPSPAAILAPTSVTESELLAQSLMFALFDLLSKQMGLQSKLPGHRRALLDGLQLWLIWEQELSLSIWHEPLVRSVLWETATSETEKTADFPADLCNHSYLWMQSPLDISIPIYCWQQNEANRHIPVLHYGHPYIQKVPLPSISDTSLRSVEQRDFGQAPPLHWQVRQYLALTAEAVALATVIEYITFTFGRDRLPILLTPSAEHQDWEQLTPSLFDLSHREFEVGWNDFLAKRYGIVR